MVNKAKATRITALVYEPKKTLMFVTDALVLVSREYDNVTGQSDTPTM